MQFIKIPVTLLLIYMLLSCDTSDKVDDSIKVFETPQLKVTSFNIRFNNPADGVNAWDNRKEHVLAYVEIEKADIIGMQEVLHDQLTYLSNNLENYSYYGIGRDDGLEAGEYSPIFYNTDRFDLLSSNTFWLSTTPEEPSLGWDAVIKRICTVVELKDKISDQEVKVFNAHFDHVGAAARNQSARLIMDSLGASNKQRIIVMGDFNTEPGTTPYKIFIDGGLKDSYSSEIRFGPIGTWNGFNSGSTLFTRRIDFVLYDGFFPRSYVTDDVKVNGNFISDHFPVTGILEYRPL